MEFRSKSGQRDRVLQHYLKGALFCDRCERNERTSRLIGRAPWGGVSRASVFA